MYKPFVYVVNKYQTESKLQVSVCRRNTPRWWREAGERGTKKLYQPEPRPVVYVIPITSILGRLPSSLQGTTAPSLLR